MAKVKFSLQYHAMKMYPVLNKHNTIMIYGGVEV
jgi:hypothetical protein